MMNAPDILAVLLVLCNFSSNEIKIILFPNMIRTFPISNNEYNYLFVPFSPPKYYRLPPPLGRFEPYGVSDLVTSIPSMCKTPKWIFTYSNGVVSCVKNRNPIVLILRKIYRFKFYVIK